MKTNKLNKSFQTFGVSALAAGAILLSSTQVHASETDKEFGDQLLYTGKTHDHVIELKELLEDSNFLELDEDQELNDEYDQSTTQAVKDFQEKYDLLVDGLAGIQTAGALLGLEKGDEGKLVLTLQEDLAELDYYEDNLDGKFGPLTEAALKDFQYDEEIEDDQGVAGPYTYSALNDLTSRYNPDIQAPVTEVDSSSQSNNANSSSDESNSSSESNDSSSSNQSEASSDENETTEESSPSSNDSETTMTLEATAYTAYCDGCSGITYTGIDLRSNPEKKVVAVDPNVIPLGSIVEVEGYGRAVAGDIGGAIKGDRIDLHVPTKDEAFTFGRQDVQVTVVETP